MPGRERWGTAPRPRPCLAASAARRGALCFVWTVPEDMDVIGPMALQLYVGLRGADDVFLFAGVRKFCGGVEAVFEGSFGFSGDMVSKGWQRAAHRALDDGLSTLAQPVHRHDRAERLRPGEIAAVQIALRPHATRFRKGEQLRLEVRGRWPYRRDPFRGQFPAGYQRSPVGVCTLHTGGAHGSHLLLGTRALAVSR